VIVVKMVMLPFECAMKLHRQEYSPGDTVTATLSIFSGQVKSTDTETSDKKSAPTTLERRQRTDGTLKVIVAVHGRFVTIPRVRMSTPIPGALECVSPREDGHRSLVLFSSEPRSFQLDNQRKTHDLAISFQLPQGLPGSFTGRCGGFSYSISASIRDQSGIKTSLRTMINVAISPTSTSGQMVVKLGLKAAPVSVSYLRERREEDDEVEARARPRKPSWLSAEIEKWRALEGESGVSSSSSEKKGSARATSKTRPEPLPRPSPTSEMGIRDIYQQYNPNKVVMRMHYNVDHAEQKQLMRISLPTNHFSLGETIQGCLTLSLASRVRVARASATLQSIEYCGEMSVSKDHGVFHSYCGNLARTTFSISIPIIAPPSFDTSLLRLQWHLRFKLLVGEVHKSTTKVLAMSIPIFVKPLVGACGAR